ncbi:MAG: tRNA pseudouridine(38-40) synthase TruA [Phycisphaera sp.]|nr:tRNA pseudouridine(38-40) synthase TruA [Phycisphaera sp.]
MPRYRLLIAYDGTDFHGWQRQIRPDGTELRTVQRSLEQAVLKSIRDRVPVVGASRTDSGVHAVGQVAAFNSEREIPIDRLAMALTSRLPDDVQVREATIVDASFDPIAHARSKCYRYEYSWGRPPETWPPLFERRTTFHTPHRLDADRMREAATRLIGTHDVAGLAQKHHGRDNTRRTIFDCRITEPGPYRVRMEVVGSGFLYNMVRIIAGTLLDVGRGHVDPDRVDRILESGDRRLAGQTLPPEGLSLRWINYDDDPGPLDGSTSEEPRP